MIVQNDCSKIHDFAEMFYQNLDNPIVISDDHKLWINEQINTYRKKKIKINLDKITIKFNEKFNETKTKNDIINICQIRLNDKRISCVKTQDKNIGKVVEKIFPYVEKEANKESRKRTVTFNELSLDGLEWVEWQ
uniref:Uncharacterized protein n=1 Tax=uncultured Caudovirales phage TaxID=2100421 RepID=A0A6J5KYT0_9CAUD|nr:hypothetical protein UFOVP88_54 [uncultured Caudovirales phage]